MTDSCVLRVGQSNRQNVNVSIDEELKCVFLCVCVWERELGRRIWRALFSRDDDDC